MEEADNLAYFGSSGCRGPSGPTVGSRRSAAAPRASSAGCCYIGTPAGSLDHPGPNETDRIPTWTIGKPIVIATQDLSLQYGKRVLFEDVTLKFTQGN